MRWIIRHLAHGLKKKQDAERACCRYLTCMRAGRQKDRISFTRPDRDELTVIIKIDKESEAC